MTSIKAAEYGSSALTEGDRAQMAAQFAEESDGVLSVVVTIPPLELLSQLATGLAGDAHDGSE